ncbi:MAG: hypothetical protein QNI92_07140 [Desulfobacterales bacterium]|nr:hypothetical protein [Desulfobacterales bacterium]
MLQKMVIWLVVISFLAVAISTRSALAGGKPDTENVMWTVGALMIFIPVLITGILEHRKESTQNENKEEPVNNKDQNDEEKITADVTVSKDKIVTSPSQTVAIFEW